MIRIYNKGIKRNLAGYARGLFSETPTTKTTTPKNRKAENPKTENTQTKKIAQTKTKIYIRFTLGLRFFRQSYVIYVIVMV